jgi:LmbE family N-acetylglucosaminyl deacetylase
MGSNGLARPAEASVHFSPILLSFADGKLGDYASDRALVYRLTERIAEELQRLHPDVIVTWGPEGGMGHPDHRMVSNIVTQLQRAGAPGVPERVFYIYMPAEAMRAMNPQRGEPPLLVPQERLATARVSFGPEDLQGSARSMACHKSQFTAEVVQRVQSAAARVCNGAIPLIPASPTAPITDLFRQHGDRAETASAGPVWSPPYTARMQRYWRAQTSPGLERVVHAWPSSVRAPLSILVENPPVMSAVASRSVSI